MRGTRWACWVLLLPLLAGCPPPPAGKSQSEPSKTATSKTPSSKTGGGEAVGGDLTPNSTPTVEKGHWPLVSPKLTKDPDFYRQLSHLSSWPSPRLLTTVAAQPLSQRPKPIAVKNLKELVGLIVTPRLRPTDLDGALGIDPKGRLHIKLGAGKATGSASLQVRNEGSNYPIFCMTFEGSQRGATTIEGLRARVSEVLVPSLAKALKQKANQLEAWPKLEGGTEVAGMALLDRQSEHGIQFPYLYGFANKTHLTVLLQEVPHAKAPGTKPR